MLRVENIQVFYGKVLAVDNISITVQTGQIAALVGTNGAGKSTLLKTIAGVCQASQGKIFFQGKDISALSTRQRAAAGIVLIPEGRRVFSEMSVRDNILVGGHLLDSVTREKRIKEMYRLFPILEQRQRQPAVSLSGGQQQMLAIARGLMTAPRLLLLDEVTLGLSPIMVKEVFSVLKGLQQQGITMIIAGQEVERALKICDQAVVIHNGRVAYHTNNNKDSDIERIKQICLGVV